MDADWPARGSERRRLYSAHRIRHAAPVDPVSSSCRPERPHAEMSASSARISMHELEYSLTLLDLAERSPCILFIVLVGKSDRCSYVMSRPLYDWRSGSFRGSAMNSSTGSAGCGQDREGPLRGGGQ